MKNLTTKKRQRSDGLTGEFSHIFREEVTLILLKIFQNIEEVTHLNSFCKVSISFIPTPQKDTIRKLHTDIPNKY